MKARVIIGANYGDEGKGTVVASYTKHATGKVLNVLTNGGAQRGHSILTEDGSFTFQHFGAGTYHGADNYYCAFFILNPMQFAYEYGELTNRNVATRVRLFRDRNCRWSTPYDMLANQIVEQLRQKDKHGSCGMGIWETVLRYENTITMGLDAFCALETAEQKKYLTMVRNYFEKRLGEIPANFRDMWYNANMVDHFIADCAFLCQKVNTVLNPTVYDEVIFENGQGLLLNDTGKDVAGTTPSKTTAEYALQIARELGCDDITLHYVTRPYLTRHGKGFLTDETNRAYIANGVMEDRTNTYNIFQDNFRFGLLDVSDLAKRIQGEEANIATAHNYRIELTHCDEMDRLRDFQQLFNDIKTYDKALIV